MLERLKQEVYEANMLLPKSGLVTLTWGNASAFDKESELMVIKPSGVSYEAMKPEDMVVVDLDGRCVEGKYRPSSDTPTHLQLYQSFRQLGGIIHTHSPHATAFAQAELDLPCYGTTHADYFFGSIPCTRPLSDEEIKEAYEKNTGVVIADTFQKRNLDVLAIPAVLVAKHGSFTWGATVQKAAETAIVLEEVAKMAAMTLALNHGVDSAPQCLLDKHYYRKHGANAYYGQK